MRIEVGVVGFGVIGQGVVGVLQQQAETLRRRSGVEIVIKRIADVSPDRLRLANVTPTALTARYEDILADDSIEIVIELVGGTTVAGEIVKGALRRGKHVVTANKALLHAQKSELFSLATETRRELRFEASVAGGIPIVKVITESLAADRIDAIYGIVNGTTNFILTKMIESQWSFQTALAKAQELGFAEADPSLDVNGGDATHKLDVLATIAFNSRVDSQRIHTEGIAGLSLTDVLYAKELGYAVKLLAIAKRNASTMSLRVHPTLIPERCSLASVSNEFNAVMLQSQFLGDSLYVGRGAGAHPTATAVVSDIIDIAVSIAGKQEFNPSRYTPFNDYETVNTLDVESRFYLRFAALERPGTLARIANILGKYEISISALIQKEASATDPQVPIVILTHPARERNLRQAVAEIDALEETCGRTVTLHLEDLVL